MRYLKNLRGEPAQAASATTDGRLHGRLVPN